MAATTSIRSTDRGFKRIVQALTRQARRARVEIGWFSDKKHPSGIGTAEIAAANEYGTETAPARPMLRRTVDERRAEYERKHKEAWGRAIDGTEPIERALLRFGNDVRNDVVRTITTGPHIPNAPSTIARKGSSSPLIDRGIMRDQVDVRVGLGSAAAAGALSR